MKSEIELVDFHVHSTASDGTNDPAEIPELAAKQGISIMALTDHDTTEGLPAFLASAQAVGIKGVPGIEISSKLDGERLHILGFNVPVNGPSPLHTFLEKTRRWRDDRNHKMVAKFQSMGIRLTYEAVEAESGGNVVGRLHFARAIVRMGVVKDPNEAFRKYLGNNCQAYVAKRKVPPEEAIQALKDSGALVLAAHPSSIIGHTQTGLEERLDRLRLAGMDGVEAYHPDVSPGISARLKTYGDRYGFIYSGGSDYHGANKVNTPLGRAWRGRLLQRKCAESLLDRLTQMGYDFTN